MKIEKKKEVQVGTIVITRKRRPKLVGEVITLLEDKHESVEVIILDKRLQPLQNGNASYKVKKFRRCDIKILTPRNFKFKPAFNLGDVIRKKYIAGYKRYGIIVGYIHPDGLYSSSYENGYNGIDLLECVEITKRGMNRKRNQAGEVKKFTTSSKECKPCKVDLWNKTGIKIID